MKPFVALLLLTGLGFGQDVRPTPFSPDSALAYLRVLAQDIGPRPMGSPGERRAMEFAVEKFRSFGLDEATILEFTQTSPDRTGARTNTRSGTVVGILRGTSGRCLVIGGHIDSAGPEIEGANDDGSGSAVVIELARVMAQREWNSTIVFCLFGGEESGLRGSRDFVAQTPLLDSIAVMLQVDMANGSPWIAPMYDVGTRQAPTWLVRGAYEEFDRLGYSGLFYPVHFYTLNNALGGGASSDHQPFLERGIPAIDFTTDVADPIHTLQDSFRWFKPGGLERSGDLVYRLTERFDAGVPPERTEQYLTLQLGSIPFFIPRWAQFMVLGLSIATALVVVWRHRAGRTERWNSGRPSLPGLKVYGATVLVALAGWLSEDLIGLMKGWRAAWYAEPVAILVPGFLVALLAVILVALWARRWKLSNDPYRYALRMAVAGLLTTILFGLVSLRLALYPSIGLLFFSLALLARPLWLQLTLVAVGLYPTARLIFSETFDFFAFAFAQIPAEPSWSGPAVTAALALVSSLLMLPAAYTLTGILRRPDLSPPGGTTIRYVARGLALLFGVSLLWILREPAYTDYRARAIKIQQTVEPGSDSVDVRIASSDYVKDVVIRTADGDTGTTDRVSSFVLPKQPTDAAAWIGMTTTAARSADTGTGSTMLLQLQMRYRPYTLDVRYEPRTAKVLGADAGPFAVNTTTHTASIKWYSFPDSSMLIPFHLALSAPDSVLEIVEATFVQQATPVSILGQAVSATSRTTVRHERTILIP